MTVEGETDLGREVVTRSVAEGDLATELLTLAELTKDLGPLKRWAHYITTAVDDPGNAFPSYIAEQIRAQLVDAIRTRELGAKPDLEFIRTLIPYAAPDLELPEDKDFYLEQIGLGSTNRVEWKRGTPEHADRFHVVVIGAGFSGIAIARYLKHLGISYTIYEKQDGCAGSWRSATYPGAGPDSAPNHFYSYSFAQKPDWSRYYVHQPEMIAYLQEVVRNESLDEDIRYNTEVARTVWDDENKIWNVVVRTASGSEETVTANVVVSAIGLLAYSHVPDFPGLDRFSGDIVDVGAWPASARLKGKRVALVGTGATANIVGPRLADMAQELKVFQRHPHWIARVDKYLQSVPEGGKWLLANVPG